MRILFRKALSLRRVLSLVLCLVLAAALLPLSAHAQKPGKTVRVGWFESSFNTREPSGRRSGYAYEYQLKLAAYTGWNYEYISAGWSELLVMLEKGEIDLLGDVSYTPERAEYLSYADLPMGTEEYYIFIARDNREIQPAVPESLNGKRIGVNRDSLQSAFYQDWAERNGVEAEIIELACNENESLQMLESGMLDAYVTVDSFTNPERVVPVGKIGSSDFYFAVNKNRPDLLEELNDAVGRIQDENRFYNERMFEKYFKRSGANVFLSPTELAWLDEHGTIRLGYQDNYLAFCAADKDTGALTGALKDYLDIVSECTGNAKLKFEAKAYPTVKDALSGMKNGEIDCVFPISLGSYEGENLGIVITRPLMRTDIFTVVRYKDQALFANKVHVLVAVNRNDPNYDALLQEHFPDWTRVYFNGVEECLKAVSDGVADCVLISNYRYNNLARLCDRYHLTTLSAGVGADLSFAVSKGETELYSILSKCTGLVPISSLNTALSYYLTEDAKLSFSDFVEDHLNVVMAVIGVVLLLILFLLAHTMQAERKARRLIAATEIDELTGLYNRDYFFQYANRMFREHPDTPMDAIVLNIEQFHTVNALKGRDFGDQILRAIGSELQTIAREKGGIAGHFGADRFDIYCRHTDDYPQIFESIQTRLNSLAQNTSIRLRMGVMPWQDKLEPVQLFDRARTACSMARGHYKEHLIVFDEKVRERELYEQRLMNDLSRAMDEYEFEVYYQPKFDIQCEPPKLISAEALVRWQHPELGMIPPADFIPLLERNGQICAVDKYVWSEAARQVARWREQNGVTLPVSVNLSRVDVFDPTLEKTLDDILQYSGLEHEAFKLEVTESAYTENANQVIQVVKGLRAKGYEVEMDDFGTGYSSLNMLSEMPVDVLKMDSGFIRNMEHDEKDIQLVALILGIAKSLKIPVIAEGVETEEQLRILKELGCEVVQGYYFSRPLHAADFEARYLRHTQPEQDRSV